MNRNIKPITAILLTAFLLSQFALHALAWNNDYSSSQSQDSYSQSWNSYKQQNNINTQPAYQQSWWSSAISSVGNFFSSIGNAAVNACRSISNFFTNIVTNVQSFFKPPEIKANLSTAPPTKDINVSPTKTINSDFDKSLATKNSINDTAKTDTYKTQATLKNNPYTHLTAEKACYDPRSAGLSQFSSKYQAIEAEYAARDKWVASQQTQPEGKLADTKPVDVLDTAKVPQAIQQPQQLNPKDIAIIAPAIVTNPDPSIMPGQHWETVKATLPVNDASKQTILTTPTQKETYLVPMDTDKYNPEEMKHADSQNFYDVFPFSQNVTVKQIADKVMTDFSTHNNFVVGTSHNVDAIKDIANRATGVVISSATGKVAGNIAKQAGTGVIVSQGISKAADIAVSNAMNRPEIKLLDNERIVFKNTCDKINNELSVGAVQSFSFQRNIITDSEAGWRNNFNKTTSAIIGFIPYLGTAIGMIKSQPYAGGQIEYKVQFNCLKDAEYKLWQVDFEYRTGDYFTSSGTKERGVIESKYTESYYDPQYGFIVKEGHHAP